MESNMILLAILAIALFGKANSVALAAALLLIAKLLGVERFCYPIIAKDGVFWGLVLLIMALLIPVAGGEVGMAKLSRASLSLFGILAMVLSCFTTYLSGLGFAFLSQRHGDLLPSLILGAVIATAFWGGVPVGPLITSGLLAVIFKFWPKKF